MSAYERFVLPLMERYARGDIERAHDLVVGTGKYLGQIPGLSEAIALCSTVNDSRLKQTLFRPDRAITVRSPIGLAAGFDKNMVALPLWQALGFGFVEGGTFLNLPYPGNPRIRIKRHPEFGGLQNSMGFPSAGVIDVAFNRMQAGQLKMVLGANVSVSATRLKELGPERAHEDIEAAIRNFLEYGGSCDFWVLNLSSPNTPGLQALQSKEYLLRLVRHVTAVLENLSGDPRIGTGRLGRWPVLLKISPDHGWNDVIGQYGRDPMYDVVEIVNETGADGVVAANTSSHHKLPPLPNGLRGGSSSPVQFGRTQEVVRFLRRNLPPETVIIGVGGLISGRDAFHLLLAGADLVQTYTAFTYQGPGMIKAWQKELLQSLVQKGYESVADLRARRG